MKKLNFKIIIYDEYQWQVEHEGKEYGSYDEHVYLKNEPNGKEIFIGYFTKEKLNDVIKSLLGAYEGYTFGLWLNEKEFIDGGILDYNSLDYITDVLINRQEDE